MRDMDSPPTPSPSTSPIAPPIDPPITVCVIEDHALLRDALVRLLSDEGFVVVAAVDTVRDGERAISVQPPDVAVVDQQLPDGLGLDLCRNLSRTNPDVTFLLYTAVASEQLAQQADEAGVSAVIPKGVRPDALLSAIHSYAGADS